MLISEILKERNISKYQLAKMAALPYSTVCDACRGVTGIPRCSAETIYRISKALGVTMEDLIGEAVTDAEQADDRSNFEIFKSNVCHRVKDNGDLKFIEEVLASDDIRKYFEKGWYTEALYLLAMLDFLSRENDIPICTQYDDIRRAKLQDTVYPTSLYLTSLVTKNALMLREAYDSAIPEFQRFNIVENEVRNVI